MGDFEKPNESVEWDADVSNIDAEDSNLVGAQEGKPV